MEDGSSPVNNGDLLIHKLSLMSSYEHLSYVNSCTSSCFVLDINSYFTIE